MPPLTSAAWLVWLVTLPGAATTHVSPFDRHDPGVVRAAIRQAAPAQSGRADGREFFVSWGYNGDRFTTSDLHISQPALGNDFTLVGVRAHDNKGWTDLFSHALTVPQYNVRFGVFLNEKWGVELALDHI